MKLGVLTGAMALMLATAAQADEFGPALQDFYDSEIAQFTDNSMLVDAIMAQNAAHSALAQSDIDALDLAWRAEVGQSNTPTISPVISNATSDFLRQMVEDSGGRITEVFIMDMHGLNVAASDVTSDYWQGDEAKFQKTHGMGPASVFIDDVELDESTQRYQGQISVTITDPATGAAVGAMTVGVDAESLM